MTSNCQSVTRDMLVKICDKLRVQRTSAAPTVAPIGHFVRCGLNHAYSGNPLETAEEVEKLDSALRFLSPESTRGNAKVDMTSKQHANDHGQWLTVIWAMRSTGWQCAESKARAWSMQSSRFSEEGFKAAWNSYNPHHSNPIRIGSLYKLATLNGWQPSGFSIQTAANDGSYDFKTAADLLNTPTPGWRIKDLLPILGFGLIFGPSGSGKTFWVLWVAGCIALGLPFFGRKVRQCPVVIVALEGGHGIAKRIRAWEQYYGTRLPDSLRIVTDPLSLLNTDVINFAEALNAEGLSGGVVIIDTLNQSAPSADENSSSDMGTIISNAKVLQRLTNSLVLLVHHTGKDKTKGPRGHSSLNAALDVAIEVDNKNAGREWGIYKLKDGESGLYFPFKLESVDLGQDEDGDPITSCVALGDVFRVNKLNPPKGKNQQAVLSAVKLWAVASGPVTYDDAVMVAHDAIPAVTGKHRKERATEALNGLITAGHLVRKGDAIEIA